jgi:hypothetical protein
VITLAASQCSFSDSFYYWAHSIHHDCILAAECEPILLQNKKTYTIRRIFNGNSKRWLNLLKLAAKILFSTAFLLLVLRKIHVRDAEQFQKIIWVGYLSR